MYGIDKPRMLIFQGYNLSISSVQQDLSHGIFRIFSSWLMNSDRSRFFRSCFFGSLQMCSFGNVPSSFSSSSVSSKSVSEYLHKCQVTQWIRCSLEKSETYLFGRTKIENLLRIHHLSDLINPEQVAPPKKKSDGFSNPLYELWLEKNWIVLVGSNRLCPSRCFL